VKSAKFFIPLAILFLILQPLVAMAISYPQTDLTPDAILITSKEQYAQLGFHHVEKPYVYRKFVLSDAHLPFAVKFRFKPILLKKFFHHFIKEVRGENRIQKIEYLILVNETYNVTVPIYETRQVEKEVYNNETGQNETILVNETYISGYRNETRYHWVWKELNKTDLKSLERNRWYIFDIHATLKPSLRNFSVDIVPSFTVKVKILGKEIIKYFNLTQFAWWNSNWQYRKKLTISNAVNEYQMKIKVYKNDGHDNPSSGEIDTEGHCKDDFGDIRFANETSELPYWIEEKVDGNYAIIWVKLPSDIESQSEKYIYMYYGNPSATTTSDGDEIFIFFDDFEGELDSNKWTTVQGSISTSNGKLQLEGTSGTKGLIESTVTFSSGVVLEVYGKANDDTQYSCHYCSMRKPGDSNYRAGDAFGGYWGGSIFETEDAGNMEQTNDIFSPFSDTWHHFKITWLSESSKFYVDDVEKASHTEYIPTVNMCVFFQEGATDGDVFEIDWVFVRKYASTEPTWSSFGSEEELQLPPTISNPQPANNSANVPVTLSQLSVEISDPDGDLMNWTIETSPNIGNSSGSNATNGTITCPVSNLTYGTTYTWYVNVTDGNFWTNETYTFTTETPDPPSNLKAVSVNTSTISLTWTKSPDTDVTVVVRKEGSYPTSPSDGTVIYNGTAEEFTDTGLNPGTAYYYRAWSWAPYAYSSSYTQDMNYTYPDAPTDLQVTSFNDTSITISWTKGDGADMTKIYRGDTLVDTVSGTTYTDTGLTPSTLYTYHLYAYDSESGYSSLTSADISQYTKPSPPHDFSFSGDQNIYITWSKGTGADYTLIRYRNDSFPSSIDDGYLLYNGTGTSYYFPTNNTLLYISAWSYDTDSKLYSDVAHAFYIVNLIPPTLSLSFLDNGSINVSWSVEVPEGINHSVMVRYSTTDYPSSISDGTLLINTSTSNYAILTDLTDGDYYFSAWTYGEKYGSSRWSSTYSTAHIRVYVKNISIVNEETGNPFNLSKVYSFLVLVPEKNWSLDLKAENVTSFEYNSSTADQLKFEVKYSSDSSTIIRYINISLITESNFTIGYPENITTFYEQMIYSKKRIPILVKNIETGCYILAGETQFIREDVIYIPAYTINEMYRLYRYEDGRYSVIGLINGGKASEINLDLILYNTSTLFDIHLEGIGVKRISSNLFLIYYRNDNNDNQKVRIQIFDGDGVIFDYNETSTPNEFTIYFDISGLSLNNTNLKIKVTAVRTDGSKRIIVKYFSTKGGYGILNSAVGAILAIGLMIFGISLVASRHAFGIVGIVLCGISIAITAISTSAWYITFLQAIFIIILVVIILIYKEQNKGVVY